MSTSTLTDSPGEATPAGAPEPGLTLLYTNGLARAGEQVSLAGRSAVLLGRQERLFPGGPLDDPRMSSRHAALARDRDHWVLVDRASKNGTFIVTGPVSASGQRVTERTLTPGDVIRLGSTFIAFGPVPRLDPRPHGELVGVGVAAATLRESVGLVAPTDQTVLLLGESGSGKEVVARELHRLSGRGGPWLAVNCASLRGELLESELFGHVRGAFTGAQRAHDGLFLKADRGTVFLDEVGEMDEAVQARLLRVLEARAIRPVGASEEVAVGTRVVAATNRDALALVRAERLRADLYARLSRWTITLPPLRERLEDLGVLARAILARAPAGPGGPIDVTADLMAALVAARWPLNVRGLVNVLEGARIAQPGVTRLDLVPRVAEALAAQAELAAAPSPRRSSTDDGDAAPDPERVSDALRAHAGNVAAAARDLGLTRQSLYRLLERAGIDATTFRR
ncbi:MAG: sigma 54-interacting transcriptional regulator [Deltaproteobacteria bacterium]|nr:sigma 54-interacting transcriptional regulator [Deltaproteobacteria bacterium]